MEAGAIAGISLHGPAENENDRGVGFRTAGVSGGQGFVFVSHRAGTYPNGFLRNR